MMTSIFVLCAYLIGSIPFAVVSSKLFDLPDPRTYGSGNPGATNVLRTGKKVAAAFTLFGDAAKGWLAVWLSIRFCPPEVMLSMLVASVVLAVFIGHLFPIFLGFKGGKGVATALGILLALDGWVALSALGTWLLMAIVFRYSSLAALAAAMGAPIYSWLLGMPLEWVVSVGIMSLLLVWRHKGNIRNLLAGIEARIGDKKKE